MPTFSLYAGDLDRSECDVFFLHGLGGKGQETWLSERGANPWPTWLVDDDPRLAVWFVDYDASPFARGSSMRLRDRSTSLLSALKPRIGDRPFVLVGHSMGGLLIKMMVEHSDSRRDDLRHVLDKLAGVVFMATPHSGSQIANLGSKVAPQLFSALVGDLRSNLTGLLDIAARYRDIVTESQLPHLIFAESRTTKGIRIVDPASSDPGIPFFTPVPVDTDHVGICKIPERDNDVYLRILDFIQECLERCPASNGPGVTRTIGMAGFPIQRDGGAPDQADRPNLPRERHDFTGRIAELVELDAALASAQRQSRPVVVVISGQTGVGKTTLVERWAARALQEGRISEENYSFVNLLGFSRYSRLEPDVALAVLLRQIVPKGTEIPPDIENRKRQFFHHVAERSMVIVLDNAAEEDHVRQLIPPRGQSLIIITSRKPSFAGLRAKDAIRFTPIEIEPFTLDDSLELLRTSLGSLVDDQLDKATAVASSCVYLPLALAMAIALMESREYTLPELAAELSESRNRLKALSSGDEASDPRLVFWTSYLRLTADGQRAFRLLGLPLGQNVDAYAVACLTGKGTAHAERVLQELKNVGLVKELKDAGPSKRSGHRFNLHDLIHQFARERADEEESNLAKREAISKLVDGYYGCVNYAFNERNPNNPMVDSGYLHDWENDDPDGRETVGRYEDVVHWFEAERENLVALVQRVAAPDIAPPPEWAPHLAFSMFYFLDIGGYRYWTEWELVTQFGLQMAVKLGDVWAQARLLRNTARLNWVKVRDYSDALRLDSGQDTQAYRVALAQCDAAINLYQESDVLYKQCDPTRPMEAATVRRELADVYLEQARLEPGNGYERAIHAYCEAERIFKQETGRIHKQPDYWKNPVSSLSVPLSLAYRQIGRYEEAENCLETALDYSRPRDGQSRPVNAGTYCYGLTRKAELLVKRYHEEKRLAPEEVLAGFDEAITAFHDNNYWLPGARALARKGEFLTILARPGDARAVWMAALEILTAHDAEEGSVVQAWIDALVDSDND